ncbi:hypothetical protein SCHIN_v1c08260 [Spiroplasma chinense]|uniref:Uncharacterized protein n=1 Tax=Spiroplasma chinense TaxID=216932 RepID=A0A5B9Y4P7_9MOLU|nr:hypothetical protein [Spiroplasma chinense]QEH62021.1 hypothetical protein SCHIN_v1c08260 [Spiroplasma chinense]
MAWHRNNRVTIKGKPGLILKITIAIIALGFFATILLMYFKVNGAINGIYVCGGLTLLWSIAHIVFLVKEKNEKV